MLNQIKTIVLKRNLLHRFLRYAHHEHTTSKILYPLESRKVVRVAGSEAAIFLQGLITNDMRHLEDGARSMYAMLLNNKGRVLYDTLVHRTNDEEAFLLECDKNTVTQLLRYLKLFKLKRKIEIADTSRDYKLWAFITPSHTLEEHVDPKTSINIIKDPRLPDLGYRILCPSFVEKSSISDIIGKDSVIADSESGYRCLRYMLGVSEGPEDLQPGISFPLEANCDYLHGVSFHKGCYIGQELTARVHHTGVVRKRIMPLIFNRNDIIENLPINAVISDRLKPKSNVGKLRGYINNYGLGLIRIKEAMEATALNIGKYQVHVVKPSWWPKEAPKEKAVTDGRETNERQGGSTSTDLI